MKKFAVCLAAMMAVTGVMAAENVLKSFTFTDKKDFSAWGSKNTYPSYEVTCADGVAKVTVKEAVAAPKSALQVMPLYKQGFKKGVTYKITGTMKANVEQLVRFHIQLSGAPYTVFPFGAKKTTGQVVKLQPDVPYNFSFEFVPQEDISALCRTPGIHVNAKSGLVLECTNFKVIEVQP